MNVRQFSPQKDMIKIAHQRGENGRAVISSLVGLRLAPHEITARHK